ncbi:MAG: alpha/beta fold hydrolase [Polaromonas sp.]|nr:alpha/beta fold hydrolase [Polaromonas sp.]
MSFDPDLYRRTLRLAGRGQNGQDLNLSVIDAGPRDALRTIVFLHGMGGYAGYWHHQLNHFYEGSRVIAPDLRGHGLSDAPISTYSRDELLGDIEAVLALLDVPSQFILVTHSFGGALGTMYAYKHPERVEKLVIIGSAVRFDQLENAGRFLLRAPSWLLSFMFKILPVGKRYPPGHVIHAQYKNAVITYDGTAYLKALTCPSLVILGDKDNLFSTKAYQAIAKLIPNAQEVTLPQSAHQVMVERPEAVNRALDRFLGPVQIEAERRARRDRHRTLEKERPWLKFYDGRTPYQIRPPQGPLQRHFEIAAKRFASTPAVQFLHTNISYKKLDKFANRFAEGMRKQGVEHGARVLIVLPNIPQAVIAYFAALKLGAVVTFMEGQAAQEVVCQRVAELGVQMVISMTNRYQDLHQSVLDAGAKTVVFTSYREFMGVRDWLLFTLNEHYTAGHRMPFLRKLKSNRQVYRFHELMSLKTDRPDTEPTVDDIAVIQYTSGAGEHAAKAVSLSHRNLVANALQIRHWLPESRVGDERILAVWTLGTGLAATVNLAPLLGATVILVPRTDPLTLLQTIKRTKPTFLPGSPRLYQLLSQVPNVRKFGMASIRVCFSGGANLPVEVQESFEKLTKGRVVDAYSTMEAGICIANPLAARKRSGSIGVPLPDVEVRLFDASTGQECGVDEVGEMWIRGPQVSQSYWSNPLATAHAMKDGWFHTGDLAKRDEDGFFYLMEREEDVIHPRLQDDGGQTGEELQDIYPSEIEEVLYELQEVAEVAVTSWREDNGALEIVAFIVPRHTAIGTLEPLDIAHLHDWCRSRLRPDARPTQFKILNKLPHSATGKVLRKALRGLM